MEKNTGKVREKSGILSAWKSGNPVWHTVRILLECILVLKISIVGSLEFCLSKLVLEPLALISE